MPRILYCISMIVFLFSTHAFADPLDKAKVEIIFNDWAVAFNHQNLKKTCDLFAPEVIASYQSAPTKNYAAICGGFKRIFQHSAFRYEYKYNLHQIYSSDALAAIRITWYLTVYKNGKIISASKDEGLDVLKFEHEQWRIVNYLAYPVSRSR